MPPRNELRLFTAIHANLDFSAMPSGDLPLVVERCYWPLLELARSGVCLGLEMPARTLEMLVELDAEWVKGFGDALEHGQMELLGSGMAQVVAPLAPTPVNRANLALGARRYRELLGVTPRTWFVNEQTFAKGLVDLYLEVGAQTLVVEWNNPASVQPTLRPRRHQVVRVAGAHGTLRVLWNDSITFQRVQQAVHGSRCLESAQAWVEQFAAAGQGGVLCAYGGDLEIFDYRPGAAPARGRATGEMDRFGSLFRGLAERYDLVLPRDAAAQGPIGPVVQPASAADPMPCKKQPRYNPTRWAVSGRDGLGINTRCHQLYRTLRAARALGASLDAEAQRGLVDVWRSDLRTRATEEKIEGFSEQFGVLRKRAREALATAMPPLPSGADLVVANPWGRPWHGCPIEVALRFPPGRLGEAALAVVGERGGCLDAWQAERRETYRDGSLRRAVFVLDLHLEAKGQIALRAVPRGRAPDPGPALYANPAESRRRRRI